jgi:hypothetical protein
MRMDAERGPNVSLEYVGRNRATTFSGICEDHDREIFAPIEMSPIDLDNPEHLFLLGYRACHYELHASCATASQVQTGYLKRVELGLDSKDGPSAAGLLATERMAIAYSTFRYKTSFDEAFLSRRFSKVTHDVIRLDMTHPTIGACALFSLDCVPRGEDVVRVCLNILPQTAQQTVAVFSYLVEDAPLARAELARVLTASSYHQRYELSRRLLNNCQNFVVAPSYFETWTEKKRDAVIGYFAKTAFKDDFSTENPDLYLF